jgi:hypothetical protein
MDFLLKIKLALSLVFSLKKNNTDRKKQLGVSLLETAIVLPAALALTFGAVDIATYIRSYNTAKEAATMAVRCIYPTDAGCQSIAAAQSIPQNNLYIPPFFSSQYDYDGQEKRLLLPDYSYGPIRTRTLESVTSTPLTNRYEGIVYGYGSTATAKTLVNEFPRISGNERFATISGGRAIAADNIPVSDSSGYFRCSNLPSIPLNNHDQPNNYGARVLSRFSFTVPTLESILGSDFSIRTHLDSCLTVDRNDDSLAATSRNINCDANSILNDARIFFKANGNAYTKMVSGNAAPDGAYFQVKAYYSFDRGRTFRQLGGQEIHANDGTDGNNANFYQRGFSPAEAGSNYNTNSISENHYNVTAPWGRTVIVEFRASQPTGDRHSCPNDQEIDWNIIGTPTVVVNRPIVLSKNSVACNNGALRPLSACGSSNGLTSANICPFQGNISFENLNVGSKTARYKFFADRCNSSHSGSIIARVQSDNCVTPQNTSGLSYSGYQASDISSINVSSVQNCPAVSPITEQCPNNFGSINGSDSLLACPPSQQAVAGSISWKKSPHYELVPDGTVKVPTADCTFNPSAEMPNHLIPDSAKQYKELFLPTAYKTGESQIDTSTQDPSELKKLSKYSCDSVKETSRDFSENSRKSFSDEEWSRFIASDFNGASSQFGCDISEQLRNQALTIGMDPKSFYKTIKATAMPNSDYRVDLNQVDSCMTIDSDRSLSATNLRTPVAGGPFDEGVIPAQCIIQGQNQCISIPAGVRQISDSGNSIINQNQIRRYAQDTINALMPGIDTEKYDIEVPDFNAENDNLNNALEVKVKIKQPLILLGGKQVDASFTASRISELKHAKN